MNNLHETILSKCRDQVDKELEVLRANQADQTRPFMQDEFDRLNYLAINQNTHVAFMAMEKLAKFYRKLVKAGWIPYGDGFWDDQVGSITHEQQLYEEYGRVKG
jgi:hypothetical protein